MIRQGQFPGQLDSGGMLLMKQAINSHQQSNMACMEYKESDKLHTDFDANSGANSKHGSRDETPPTPPLVSNDVVPTGQDTRETNVPEVTTCNVTDQRNEETGPKGQSEEGNDNIGRSREPSTWSNNNMSDLNRGMKTRGNRRPILLTERMRQKRQTLQDMAKPLKTWLYEHRDNPYPTKTEKLVLAVGSQMTLVQVSNWFANARRRLKNTVRQPGLSWSNRIKMYNSHVTGNAERLSICSTASSISDIALEEEQVVDDINPQLICYETASNYSSRPPSTMSQDAHMNVEYNPESTPDEGAPNKFKHTILHRYLNDSFEHAQRYHHQKSEYTRRRNGSGAGSVSSHEYEDVTSRLSPHSMHSSDVSQQGNTFFDDLPNGDLSGIIKNRLDSSLSSQEDEDTYWKEINAALVLTNMARACRQQQPITS